MWGYYSREVMVGIGSYNPKNNTVKVSSWDVYDLNQYWTTTTETVDGVNKTVSKAYTFCSGIDLSKLNNKKDNYIAVKTNLTEPVYIKIPASIKGQKAVYNAASHTLEIKNIKGVSDTDYKNYNWEYRTAYSDWSDIDNYTDSQGNYILGEELECYEKEGASLYVRAAAGGSSITNTETTVKDANDKSADPVEYPLYLAKPFPGKESKINIPKQAKGPAVAVDYVNNKIKLPKDTEFRVIACSHVYPDNYVGTFDNPYDEFFKGISDDSIVDVEKFLENTMIMDDEYIFPGNLVSGALEVRKKADVSKRKPASKWTIVDITYPTEMAIKADDASLSKLKDGAIVASEAAFNVSGGAVTVKYVYDGKGNYKNKVNITNGGKMSYQVVIKSGVPAASDKATLIKANSTKAIKANKGDSIYIRTAGNKKEKIFAGKYTFVAKTNY